jgi:hypothetical protein
LIWPSFSFEAFSFSFSSSAGPALLLANPVAAAWVRASVIWRK